MLGIAEVYQREGWPRRFGFTVQGLGVEGSGMGTGFTARDVALVKPHPGALRAYLDALWTRTQAYLVHNSGDALARECSVPWWLKPTTPARVLSHIVAHSYVHIGEAGCVRGLMPK